MHVGSAKFNKKGNKLSIHPSQFLSFSFFLSPFLSLGQLPSEAIETHLQVNKLTKLSLFSFLDLFGESLLSYLLSQSLRSLARNAKWIHHLFFLRIDSIWWLITKELKKSINRIKKSTKWKNIKRGFGFTCVAHTQHSYNNLVSSTISMTTQDHPREKTNLIENC